MKRPPEIENTKRALLPEINQHRARRGRASLASYPDEGCCCCGEGRETVGPLVNCRRAFLRKCQQCLLEQYPFKGLRLPAGETITWFGHNPTFHRSGDYGIVLSDKALYLYSPFWFSFARWKRVALQDITEARFRDSKFLPALLIHQMTGVATLRTPLDYADEMDFDREVLKEAADRISASQVRWAAK